VEGDTTFCPGCHEPVIARDWYQIRDYRLDDHARCPTCQTRVAGHFQHFDLRQQFGARRIPVAMHLA
jgi:pyruvate formate lyase activating enzyme